MAAAILIEERLEIPANLGDLAEFRRWATADDFPETGRIDFVTGRIEVDMSPEDLHTHGTPKVELVRVLANRVRRRELGELYTDRTRVSCPGADLSVEPDIVFVSNESLDAGRIRLIAKSSGQPDRYVEVEGPPDVVVEIVSDSSVRKDKKRLPPKYWQAGVAEFWLVDARSGALRFRVFRRGDAAYEPAPRREDGFQYSTIFDCWYRLVRRRNRYGRWQYTLREKDASL